jgi:hypothetical protein
MSGEVVVYLNVRRAYGVSYCQERWWCILLSGEIVVYLNVRRAPPPLLTIRYTISSPDIKIHHHLS